MNQKQIISYIKRNPDTLCKLDEYFRAREDVIAGSNDFSPSLYLQNYIGTHSVNRMEDAEIVIEELGLYGETAEDVGEAEGMTVEKVFAKAHDITGGPANRNRKYFAENDDGSVVTLRRCDVGKWYMNSRDFDVAKYVAFATRGGLLKIFPELFKDDTFVIPDEDQFKPFKLIPDTATDEQLEDMTPAESIKPYTLEAVAALTGTLDKIDAAIGAADKAIKNAEQRILEFVEDPAWKHELDRAIADRKTGRIHRDALRKIREAINDFATEAVGF